MSEWPEALVEKVARELIATHWDGTGCGTTGTNACSNCFGSSPMDPFEVTRTVLDALGLEEQRQCHMASGQWLTCHITDCETPKRTRHTLGTPWEDA